MFKPYRFVFICLLMMATQAFAWWETPHMLVANIAYEEMTPHARERADKLIALHAKQYPKTADFVTASVWADDIKGQGNKTYSTWHYVTLTFKDVNEPLPTHKDFPSKYHVSWAINEEIKLLKDPNVSEDEKGLALRRLIHWVGDIHQPLHATTHISPNYPKGDSGGNLFKVNLPKPMHNLHTLWDSGLNHWIDVDRPLTPAGKSQLDHESARLMATYGHKELGTKDPYLWAINSHDLARHHAYTGLDYNGTPSVAYTLQGEQLTDIRVTLAGQRLARILNEVFN